MGKPTKEGLQNVVYLGTPNRVLTQSVAGLDIAQCLVTSIIGYNFRLSVYIGIPQIIIATIIIYMTERTHLMNVKRCYFLTGIAGVLMGIGCSVGSFLLSPREGKALWLAILFALSSFLLGASIGFFHDYLIAHKKAPWLAMLGMGASSAGVLGAHIGMGAARVLPDIEHMDWMQLGYIAYLLLAFFGGLISMGLIRSYYANLLEKLEEERTPKRRMACRY
ncbi:MAG: hypothetical protein IJW40_08475 [Clostridia bacterium]|nr:hypothetical protein [Clostridia bacterium]